MLHRVLQFAATRPVRLACAGLAIALTVNLFYLGAGPGAVNLFQPPWDKVAHFTAFAVLTALVAIGVGLNRVWIALGIVVLIGLADEAHQATLPGRHAGIDDWVIDAAAAMVVVSLFALAMRRRVG
ncbi:MAG: VanZ family protein [Burkholderiales bacterium]|jgi:VanZ family protein|nr:VanZ family protein [Burkholderiales bacterium]